MKTNKFLVFALLLVSFALQAETTFYKRDGKGGWIPTTKEKYDNSFKTTGIRSEVISIFDIDDKTCRSAGGSGYARCDDDQEPRMWVDFTSPAPKANIIGGNPNTWAPQNEKPLLGRDPKTWTPATSSAPRANANIGGDKNTWAPSGEPTYQDSTGLLGRSNKTYAPTKNAIIG